MLITRTCLRDLAPTAPNSMFCPEHTKQKVFYDELAGLNPIPPLPPDNRPELNLLA